MDVVLPEYLAGRRFASVFAAAWHDAFEDGGIVRATEISLVASCQVFEEGLEADTQDGLWYLDEGGEFQRMAESVRKFALPYFDGITGSEGVLRAVRPEYREAIERRLGGRTPRS